MSVPGSSRATLATIVLDDLENQGVHAVVTTRSGGVSTGTYASLNLGGHVGDDPSSVSENRSRLAGAMGVAPDALVIANQVHGARVAVVRRGDDPGDADVLVTTDPTIAICVLVADCVPAVLIDPVARVLAVVHAGWRGIAAQTAIAALDAAVSLGADPRRCRAHVGPCISPRAYQVGEEVVAAFVAVGCGDDAVDDAGGFRVDLAGACVRQLVGSGVPADQVVRSVLVTDGGARFFSDRSQRPSGRFAIAARLDGSAS
jgi:YfiH family protein